MEKNDNPLKNVAFVDSFSAADSSRRSTSLVSIVGFSIYRRSFIPDAYLVDKFIDHSACVRRVASFMILQFNALFSYRLIDHSLSDLYQ